MNSGKPPARDWRAQPPVPTLYTREWRGTGGRRSERFSRKFKLRVVGLGLILLVAAIILMLAPTGSRVPPIQIVTFGIGSYGGRSTPQGNMPINAFGEQDAKAFQVLHELHPAQFLPVRQEDNVLNGAQLLSFLKSESNAAGLTNSYLIVFLTLHGIVRPSGDVELFAIDATPDSGSGSSAMIPVNDVLTILEEAKARRVLLILDAARLTTDWRLGILNNDVAAQFASIVPATAAGEKQRTTDRRKVSILLSAGPGQRSWPVEDRSAIVQFLIQGLMGPADGWVGGESPVESGTHDRRVSLLELVAFVRRHVGDWTREHFGVTQTIQLLGNTTDFDLAVVSPLPPSDLSLTSLKSVKPTAIKGAALQAAKAADKKPQPDASGQPPDKAAETDQVAVDKKDDANSNKSIVDVNWQARLEELWKTRDSWRDLPRQGQPNVHRRMPLSWRAFESQLALASALQLGGLDELSPEAVRQADATFKKLQNQATFLSGINDAQRLSLRDLGFGAAADPAPDVVASTGKLLLALLKEPPPAQDAARSSLEVNPEAVQIWLRQELRRDASSDNWGRLQLIVSRLDQIGKMPQTAESQFVRDVLSAERASERFGKGDVLQRIFSLRKRFQTLAIQSPESLPIVQNTVVSGIRSLNAAERWLLASDSTRPEVRDWLDKSDQYASDAEVATQRYADAVSIWSELLIDLPHAARWIATRANDDEQRKVDWGRLRELSRLWSEQEQQGKWETSRLIEVWPDKPARLTDIERRLLAQFINAQQLKVALNDASIIESGSAADELTRVVSQATANKNDFEEELRRALPRLGTATRPTPSLWRETDRLFGQQWLPFDEHRRLGDLRRLEPKGEPLADRSAEPGSLWQGFWAIATLSLMSSDQQGTADLWKQWERLLENSHLSSERASTATATEQESLRKRRAELGEAIRQQWSSLQNRSQAVKVPQRLPVWYLAATTADPTILPVIDPDVQIRDEEQRQFANWLVLFAADWRSRSNSIPNGDVTGYGSLAQRAEDLAQGISGARRSTEVATPLRFRDEKPPLFDAKRRARLQLSAVPTEIDSRRPLKIFISGTRVRLIEGSSLTRVEQSIIRPFPASGQFPLELQLDDDVETPQSLLVALTESEGYPVSFHRIPLHPPFDPSQWRIELVEAATNVPLEHVPLSNLVGAKVFLPPMAAFSVRANLIRPTKDATPAAKLTIFGLTESGRTPLVQDLALKLEAGKERTAILCDLPIPSKDKDKEPPPKDQPPLADLARGLVFEILPEDQKAIEYQIRPTFWSATKFVGEPQPIIREDRLTLDLERRPAATEDVLLPAKIPVELTLPDSLKNTLTDYALGGPVAVGQRLTLSFALPKNWSDQARDNNWNLALDVAGLPHAYRWRIEPTGIVSPVSGLPPQLNIRLVLPPGDPKMPPRLEPVIRKGKEPLRLQLQVDSTELDRTEETGDWTLAYTVVRETETGSEPTPLQNSWRLFSSVRRHVLLDSIQAGIWKLRTSAENYEREDSEAEIRGLSGRFQVQANLTRSGQASLPLATAKLRFAIDDDAPPAFEVKGLTSESRLIDKDLAFRIEAADLESGIQRLAFGFDLNGDKQLQDDEELIEQQSFVGLDNPRVTWPVVIPRAKLPKLEKEEETRQLIVQARNGLGTVATRAFPVTFRKPKLPTKLTTGTLVVNLSVSRGAQSSVQISGPASRLEETKADSLTFTDLPPGQYQVTVKVNYAVIGRKDNGEAKIDIKVGETTTVKVPLTTAK